MGGDAHDNDFELQAVPLETLDKRAKRGRPAGAINKKTVALRQYLGAMGFKDPAVVLAQTYSRPVEELALWLGCEKADAFKMQISAAESLMPYLHGKMPLKVEIDDKPMPVVVMNFGSHGQAQGQIAAAGGATGLGIMIEHQSQENEQILESENEKSHAEKSHDQGKLL